MFVLFFFLMVIAEYISHRYKQNNPVLAGVIDHNEFNMYILCLFKNKKIVNYEIRNEYFHDMTLNENSIIIHYNNVFHLYTIHI